MRRISLFASLFSILITMALSVETCQAEQKTRVYVQPDTYRFPDSSPVVGRLAERMKSSEEFELFEKLTIDTYKNTSGISGKYRSSCPQDLWGKRKTKPFLPVVANLLEYDLAVGISTHPNSRMSKQIFGLSIFDTQTGILLVDMTSYNLREKESLDKLVENITTAGKRRQQLYQGKDLLVCSVEVDGSELPPKFAHQCEGLARLTDRTLMRIDGIATISPGTLEGFLEQDPMFLDATTLGWPKMKTLSPEVKSLVKKVLVKIRPAETEGQFHVDMEIGPLDQKPQKIAFTTPEIQIANLAKHLAITIAKNQGLSSKLVHAARIDTAKRYICQNVLKSPRDQAGLEEASVIAEIVMALEPSNDLLIPFQTFSASNAARYAVAGQFDDVERVLQRHLEMTEMRIDRERDLKKVEWYGFFHPKTGNRKDEVFPSGHPFFIPSFRNGILGDQWLRIDRFDYNLTGVSANLSVGSVLWQPKNKDIRQRFDPIRLEYQRLLTERITPRILEVASFSTGYKRLTVWLNTCDQYLPALSATPDEYLTLRIPLIEEWLKFVDLHGVRGPSSKADWAREYHKVLLRLICRQKQFEFISTQHGELSDTWQFDAENHAVLAKLFHKMNDHSEPSIRFAGQLGLVFQQWHTAKKPLDETTVKSQIDAIWKHLDDCLEAKSVDPVMSRRVCYHLGIDMAYQLPTEELQSQVLTKLANKMLDRGDLSWPVMICALVKIHSARSVVVPKSTVDSFFSHWASKSPNWRPEAIPLAVRGLQLLDDNNGNPPTFLTDSKQFKEQFTIAAATLKDTPREVADPSKSSIVAKERIWDLDLDRPGQAPDPTIDTHTVTVGDDGNFYVLRTNCMGDNPYPRSRQPIASSIVHQIDTTDGSAKIIDQAFWPRATSRGLRVVVKPINTTLYGGQRRCLGLEGDLLWIADLRTGRIRIINLKTKEIDWVDSNKTGYNEDFFAVAMLNGNLFIVSARSPLSRTGDFQYFWRYDTKTKKITTLATPRRGPKDHVFEEGHGILQLGHQDMVVDRKKNRILLFERIKRQWYAIDGDTSAVTSLASLKVETGCIWTGHMINRKIVQAQKTDDSLWRVFEFDVDTLEYEQIIDGFTSLQPPFAHCAGSAWSGRPLCRVLTEGEPNELLDPLLPGFKPLYVKELYIRFDHLKRAIIPFDRTIKKPQNKSMLVSNGHAIWLLDVVDSEK